MRNESGEVSKSMQKKLTALYDLVKADPDKYKTKACPPKKMSLQEIQDIRDKFAKYEQ
tara:strand:- start:140 stop:313 length:174 start_codon:yes stop_codon:yes gene_type:complete